MTDPYRRLSINEAVRLGRLALERGQMPSFEEIGRLVRSWRLAQFTEEKNVKLLTAAWVLMVGAQQVQQFIDSGRLPATMFTAIDGRRYWHIPMGGLRAFAAEWDKDRAAWHERRAIMEAVAERLRASGTKGKP